MSEFRKTLAEIRDFLDVQSDSAEWFAVAYLSWYRTRGRLVNLQGVIYLDNDKFNLFVKMLKLRDMPGWCDQALFGLEQYAIALYGLHRPEEVRPEPGSNVS